MSSALSPKQRAALAALRAARGPRGYYGIDVPTLAERLDTSPEGAAATASSLVRRGLAERFRGGLGPARVHYQAVEVAS